MMKVMERVQHAGEIDLSEWSFGFGDLDRNVANIVTDVLKDELKATEFPGMYAALPFMWAPESDGIGGSAVTDPLMMDIALPLGKEDYYPRWRISLRNLIFDEAESTDSDFLVAIRDRLREIADEIDATLAADRLPTERREQTAKNANERDAK